MDSHIISIGDGKVIGIVAGFDSFKKEYGWCIITGLDLSDKSFFCTFCREINLCRDLFCLAGPGVFNTDGEIKRGIF